MIQSSSAWATRLRNIRTLSLSPVKPSPSSIKEDALSPNIRDSSHSRFIRSIKFTSTESPGLNHEHTLEHLVHSGAPITLGPSSRSLTGPLVPPILLLLVCNPTANFKHLGTGIKSPTDSNWTKGPLPEPV